MPAGAESANAKAALLGQIIFETLLVSKIHFAEKHRFRQNPRRFTAAAALASAEHFQNENALD
ncbi:MAG: hypothetical protein RRY20_05900 [Bilophila sp.]